MPPFLFIENDRTRGLPTGEKTWIRNGPAVANFEAIDVLPKFTDRAVASIEQRTNEARAGKPFFLYLALTAPHTPILASPAWQDRSGITPYADFVMQVDSTVGQVVETLERSGLTNETLVIFTSDNGGSPAANFDALAAKGHHPSFQSEPRPASP